MAADYVYRPVYPGLRRGSGLESKGCRPVADAPGCSHHYLHDDTLVRSGYRRERGRRLQSAGRCILSHGYDVVYLLRSNVFCRLLRRAFLRAPTCCPCYRCRRPIMAWIRRHLANQRPERRPVYAHGTGGHSLVEYHYLADLRSDGYLGALGPVKGKPRAAHSRTLADGGLGLDLHRVTGL